MKPWYFVQHRRVPSWYGILHRDLASKGCLLINGEMRWLKPGLVASEDDWKEIPEEDAPRRLRTLYTFKPRI